MTDMKPSSIIRISAVASVVWALAACTSIDREKFDFVEYGVSETEIEFPAKAEYKDGKPVTELQKVIDIYSNQDCVLSYADSEVDWMRIRDLDSWQICRQIAFSGDCSFRIECDQNGDYARMVKLVVKGGPRTDTIYVKQNGKRVPELSLAHSSEFLDGDKDSKFSVAYTTNVSDWKDISCRVSYTGESSDWITSATVEQGSVSIACSKNPTDDLRTASVKVCYTDGFGAEYGQTLYIVQKTKDNGIGKSMSFAEVRALGRSGESAAIDETVIIEGYIVSNRESGNVGENEKKSSTSSDNTAYLRKAYIESLDGQYGFLLKMETADDNIFERYDRVSILLKGTEILREDNPERYEISGLTVSNVLVREAGTASAVPSKEKHISELTDSDIYTYVSLLDCEFPVRKGSLTPLNDSYTISNGKGNISKYPRLVRDVEGGSIYTYTSTTCPYRRDGVKLPYGRGTLKGVIVHELFPNYVYGDSDNEDLYGNIGRYQIRHQSWSDIDFDKDGSFSNLLVEFRYAAGFKTVDGVSYFPATEGDPTAKFWHTSGGGITKCPSTFNYIGWTGTTGGVAPFRNHIGLDTSLEEPLGYSFAEGYVFDYSKTNDDGRGKVGSTNKCTYNGAETTLLDGWMNKTWWTSEDSEAESWIIEFSTKGISAEHLSMQFTSYGAETGSTGKSPYNWTVWWSESGDLKDASAWTKIADYVVPDGVVTSSQQDWQLPAMKQYDFPLPSEMLGKDRIYIRLQPSDRYTNTAFFGEGLAPTGAKSANGMDYFAVRYN